MISFFTGSGGAGLIRGEQIAEKIGARVNPKSGYENDICIFVKKAPFNPIPRRTYIDVVEDSEGLRWVKHYPEISVIASSKTIYNHLKSTLKNRIVFIPQHHCNFERVLRTRKRVKVAGIIGNKASFQHNWDDLAERLCGIGIELKMLIKKVFDNRKEICDFYKTIDIQLVWRPSSDGVMRNPLKLANASSFGIPTVSYPEADFVEEFDSSFVRANSIDDLVWKVDLIKKSKEVYDTYSKESLKIAEEHHIDKVSKLYLKL